MFERFTDRARRVLVLAQEEARLLDHNFLGTEHILLGLVHEGEGVAAKALESFGIGLESVRQRVKESVGPKTGEAVGAPPFTPRAKKVLELSLREALQLGHNYIGTEHLLLGLIREGEGVAAQVLASLNAPPVPDVRERVIALLRGHTGKEARSKFTPAGATVADRAQMEASAEPGTPAGTQHFLLALLADANSLAAKVLGALGVSEPAVREKIAEIGAAGTSDEAKATPQPVTFELARGIRITVDDAAILKSIDLDDLKRRFDTGT